MTTLQKILVLEDEQSLSFILCDILSAYYEVQLATTNKQAEELLCKTVFDLAVVDLALPDGLALDLIQSIRKKGASYQNLPIIVVSGSNTEEMRCQAFQHGADDFVAKPFSYRELLVRIDQKVRKNDTLYKSSTRKTVGNVVLDSSRFEVLVDDKKISTSVLEFNLLKYFIENQNVVISRKQILKNLWNNLHVTERTIDTHVATIRKKINHSALKIETVYGAGYILSVEHAKHQNKPQTSE